MGVSPETDGAYEYVDFEIPLLDDGGVIRTSGVNLSHALQMLVKRLNGELEKLNFNGMDLSGVILGDCKFIDCTFDGVVGDMSLSGAEFLMCSFSGADLSGSRIGACKFYTCGMHDVILDQAKIYLTLFDDVFMDRARMERSRIDRSDFRQCHMPGASLREARLDETRFAGCDLARADFSGIWFVGGGPDACELVGNDMRDTLWRGAIVLLCTESRGNDVDCADFRGAWMSCIEARFGFALGFVLPRTFRFGSRTRLPLAPLPYAYAYPRTAAALLALGMVATFTALLA